MRKIYLYFTFALITSLITPLFTRAQDATDSALRAAFIFNLAKFTEWPVENPSSNLFSMCILGDAAVKEALERAVKGRQLHGADISVANLMPTGSVRGCRLIYLSGVTREQAAKIVADVHGAPVLTISDLGGFYECDGIVELYFEHGQQRFIIGMESVRKSGLQLSARILSLAKIKW